MECAKLMLRLEVQQVRRLATLLVFAVGAALGCGPRPPAGAAQEPEPHATAAAAAPLSDAAEVYRSMGFIVAGAPLPFVATIRYLRAAASDSTLAVFALSLADHSLSFRRDGNEFVAQYHVEVTFGSDTSPVRQLVSDEVVRVRTFQETLRADESVIYQRFVGLRPGVYPISVAVRDRNRPGPARGQRGGCRHRAARDRAIPGELLGPVGDHQLRSDDQLASLLRTARLARQAEAGGAGGATGGLARLLQDDGPGAHDPGKR